MTGASNLGGNHAAIPIATRFGSALMPLSLEVGPLECDSRSGAQQVMAELLAASSTAVEEPMTIE